MDNGLHSAFQGLVALLNHIDKPLCRIQFLLHELHRLPPFNGLVGLIAAVILKHILILLVDAQLRNTSHIQTQSQLTVVRLHQEIRHDLAHCCLYRIAPTTPWLRIHQGNLPDRLFQPLLLNLKELHDAFIAFIDKVIEIAVQDPYSQLRGSCFLPSPQLNQQALFQVPCTDTGWFKILNNAQHLLKLRLIHLQSGLEDQVIGDSLQISTQIAIIVDIPDDVFSDLHLFLRQVT